MTRFLWYNNMCDIMFVYINFKKRGIKYASTIGKK